MQKSKGYSKSLASNDFKTSLPAYLLIFVIYMYRYTLSPLFGNSCRFYPTCSQYAEDALRKHGVLRGSKMAVKRLLKCHPWHEGGYDPLQ